MSPRLPAGALSAVVAVCFAAGTALVVGVGWVPTAVGIAGVCLVAASYPLGDRRIATAGGGVLYLAVVIASAGGVGGPTVVLAGAGAFLAWAFSRTAAGLRSELAAADARSLEVTHLGGTAALVIAGIVATLVPFLIVRPRLPPLSVATFALAGVFLAAALRRYDR